MIVSIQAWHCDQPYIPWLRAKACRWWQAELLCAVLALGALQAFFKAVQPPKTPLFLLNPPAPPPHPPGDSQHSPTLSRSPDDGVLGLITRKAWWGQLRGVRDHNGLMFCTALLLLWGASLAKEIGITFVRPEPASCPPQSCCVASLLLSSALYCSCILFATM